MEETNQEKNPLGIDEKPAESREERKSKEADFHDKIRDRELEKDSELFEYFTSNRKYYMAARKSQELMKELVSRYSKGKIGLDYCCGEGENAIIMAESGAAKAYGIDISPYSIGVCQKKAEEGGLSGKTDFRVMDAEKLEFPDNTFDFIVCAGVLHHLDVKKVYPQLLRVLKPDGVVVCSEPLIYNPVFQYYRRSTPHLRTEWETEHILRKEDITLALDYFEELDMKFYNLATLAAVLFGETRFFKPALSVMEAIDSVILKIPGLRWWAWQCIYTLKRPKKNPL